MYHFITELQAQVQSLNSACSAIFPYYTSIAENVSILKLPIGIYNIGSSELNKINDLPAEIINGRSMIIANTASYNEKVILLMNSKNKKMYFAYQYGDSIGWKSVNLTSL